MTISDYTWYCIKGTAIYFALSSVFAYTFLYIGSYDTDSQFIENWYFRGENVYNSIYLSGSKFVYYWFMNLVGYTFVNIVNLQNVRKCPILDQHMSPKSFYKTALVVAPALFFISMNVNLMGEYDLKSYDSKHN